MSFDRRKIKIGTVLSDSMDKTVVVQVEWRTTHRLYKKSVRRRGRLVAHDSDNISRTGDTVRLIESRPISKTKRWRVAEILEREEPTSLLPEDIGINQEEIPEQSAGSSRNEDSKTAGEGNPES